LPGIHASSDISVAGPLARSAADLKLAMDVLAHPDTADSEAVAYRLKQPRARKWQELRVAVMLGDPVSEVDRAVEEQIGRLVAFLSPRVKSLSEAARPAFSTEDAWRVYIGLLRSATSRRQSDDEFAANAAKVAALRPDDQSYVALMLRGYTMSHRDWLHLNNRRHAMMAAWAEFFREYDVLLCPAAASAAFPHDHKGERHERTIIVNGRPVSTMDQLFWAGYSGVAYLPSTVAPIGLTEEGLPVGVQIVAARHEDLTSIAVAALIERDYWSFRPPPDYP
jgi:amidase